MKILNDLNNLYELKLGESYYIETEKFHVYVYRESIHFTDITNALKRGKNCMCTVMYSLEKDSSPVYALINFIDDLSIANFFDNIRHGVYLNRPELLAFGVEFKITQRESKRVFSPFVVGKSQAVSKISRVNQVVQAILSGQVEAIVCEGYYTDDYANDAAMDFQKGRQTDPVKFAKEVTESPKSWAVIKNRNGEICLASGAFDYERVIFK